MRQRYLLRCGLVAVILAATSACSGAEAEPDNPELAPRGTTLTTAKPSHQDLTSKLSLTGKVTLNPVFGVVAPIAGQVRYLTVPEAKTTPTKATRVANIWVNGKSTAKVEVPAGATFAGRLVDDRSTVTAGIPIASGKHVGYGLVADIDGAQAYRITDALLSVQAQIANGPGPFACSVLGTIAALPAGTIPDPPAVVPPADPTGQPIPPPMVPGNTGNGSAPSEPTGLRLVCTAPANVKLINGASATIEVITAKATNAMVLPVEAVAGTQGKGQVDVLQPDGSRKTVEVELGLSDGKVVEIKSGLTGTETLAVPGPNLPAAPPDGKGMPGGMK